MNNLSVKKLSIGLLVLAFIVAGGVILFAKLNTQPTNAPVANQEQSEKKPAVEVMEVDVKKLPDNFPSDIPLEAGAKIVQNYNVLSGGEKQATRSFVTQKTLAQNYELYSDFMKSNGWEIQATVDNPTSKMVMGTKGSMQLQVTMGENSSSAERERTVTIYVTESSSQ